MRYRLMRSRLSDKAWLAAIAVASAVITVVVSLPDSPSGHTQPSAALIHSVEDSRLAAQQQVVIPVYVTKEQTIEQVPLETYVRNVIAAEMPAQFELEALKAQAIASRTYIVKRWLEGDTSQVPVQGALVTDTIAHQAYVSESRLLREWSGEEAGDRLDKISRAVEETAGIILTYERKPIQASFFSTSNGYTENAEEYWRDYVPYLRSVPSPWDKELSPKYEATSTFTTQEVAKRLGIASSAASSSGSWRVLSTTAGNRVKTISIGGKTFTGREVREKLGLNSSQFTWKQTGASIAITTYGYGHGVGMSQWGANGMAKSGSKAEDILRYYYKGVELERLSALLQPGV